MKKVILLLGAIVLTLTSCTKDKTAATPTAAVGMLKGFTTDSNASTITYDGSKIVKVQQATYSESYSYSGDLIATSTYIDGSNQGSTAYTYDNGKLISELTKDNGGSGTTLNDSSSRTYTYNSDGTLTITEYYHSGGQVQLVGTTKLTFANGNIVKEEDFNAQGQSDETITYEYDTKNNPFKKITGFDILYSPEMTSANNITKSTDTYASGSSSTTTVYTNVYTYTADGYPLTKTANGVRTVGTNAPQTKTSSTTYQY